MKVGVENPKKMTMALLVRIEDSFLCVGMCVEAPQHHLRCSSQYLENHHDREPVCHLTNRTRLGFMNSAEDLPSSRFKRLQWFFPIAVTLHNSEEAIWFPN